MDPQDLARIGFTIGEAKVYLALLRLGTTTTGPLAAEASVSSSKVYKILARLEKKGLAGHTIKQKVKHFQAIDPKRILDYLGEQEESLRKQKDSLARMLPEFELQKSLAPIKEESVVFEGFKAVTNLFHSILSDLKAGDTYHVIGATYAGNTPGQKEFFSKFHRERAKHKIKVKFLANYDMRHHLVPETALLSEVRYLPEYLISNMQITFYKDTAFIVLWVKYPKAFLIKSPEVVAGFRRYFDAFWKVARPLK